MTPGQLGRARLAGRRAAARRIRRWVAAAALIAFLAAWLTIYVQMVSGNDPALALSRRYAAATKLARQSHADARAGAAQSATLSATASSGDGSSSKSSGSGSSSSGGSGSSLDGGGGSSSSGGGVSSPSPVTTGQS